MTAATAILGPLPPLVLPRQRPEIERPLAAVMIGGLVTSRVLTLRALPMFYLESHHLVANGAERWRRW